MAPPTSKENRNVVRTCLDWRSVIAAHLYHPGKYHQVDGEFLDRLRRQVAEIETWCDKYSHIDPSPLQEMVQRTFYNPPASDDERVVLWTRCINTLDRIIRLAGGSPPKSSGTTEPEAESTTKARSKAKGGANRKWDELCDLADKLKEDDPAEYSDQRAVNTHNSKYGKPIADGTRKKATVRALRDARRYRNKQNH